MILAESNIMLVGSGAPNVIMVPKLAILIKGNSFKYWLQLSVPTNPTFSYTHFSWKLIDSAAQYNERLDTPALDQRAAEVYTFH